MSNRLDKRFQFVFPENLKKDANLLVTDKLSFNDLSDFVHERDFPDSSLKKIRKHIKRFTVLREVICGKSAPGKFRVCIDFKVHS